MEEFAKRLAEFDELIKAINEGLKECVEAIK